MQVFLKKLGLTQEESALLKVLLKHGELSVLDLSKKSGIHRVTAYRILRGLQKKGLVVHNPNIKSARYAPPPLHVFEKKVEQKREEIHALANSYLDVLPGLEKLYGSRANDIRVVHYTGRDQARELCWNALQAKGAVKSFGYRSLRESLGFDFLVKWWNETLMRKIPTHMLANPETYRLKSTPGPDAADGFLPHKGLYARRYFEENELKIVNETFIYNDVFAVLHWDDKNIFGVEIHHPMIARQQEYVFDDLWERAKVYAGEEE